MTFRTVRAVCLGVIFTVAALAGAVGGAGATTAVPAVTPFSEAKPVNVVILADESGSMATYKNEISGEQQAAAAIAQAAWSPQSQVAIYGFGSAPPGAPSSAAVDKLCGLTTVSPANTSQLTRCAQLIAVRPAGEDNTDFGAALTEAENVLKAPDPLHRVPLVFMLTDGAFDPTGSGTPPPAAVQQLNGVILPAMKNLGIQIWPVGFGQADIAELKALAAGGSQVSKDCPVSGVGVPQVTTVPTTVSGVAETEQIQQQLLRAFAEASCGTITPGQWFVLQPGASKTLYATVDPLATLGSIVVNKGDAGVQVTYAAPGLGAITSDAATSGPLPQGTTSGMTWQLARNSQSAAEALRLDNPVTGQWGVTFHNPTQQPQIVGLSVVWQGQLYPDITFSPVTGDSGQPLQILVKPALNSRPVPASELSKLHVSIGVTWASGATQQVVAKLIPASQEFAGTVRVPAGQQGTAQVIATVQKPGVIGWAPAPLAYRPGGGLSVTLSVPQGTRVSPGGSLTENATVANVDQPPANIEFLLNGLGNGVIASIAQPAGAVTVGSGNETVPVTVYFGPHTHGPVLATVQWKVKGTSEQYPAGFLDVNVAPPPTPWYEQWWPYTALALVLLAVGGGTYARHRSRQKEQERKDVESARVNQNVRDAGLALFQRDKPARAPYLRYAGVTRGDIRVRRFAVNRAPGGIPVLVETTDSGAGQLELRGDPRDGTFIVTAQAPDEGPAAERRVPLEEVDKPFDTPDGAGLDGLQLVVTLGNAPEWEPPRSGVTYVPGSPRGNSGEPSPIRVTGPLSVPRNITLGGLTSGDDSSGQ